MSEAQPDEGRAGDGNSSKARRLRDAIGFVALQMARERHWDRAIRAALGIAETALGADAVALWHVDDESGELHLAASTGVPEADLFAVRDIPFDGPLLVSQTARMGQVQVIERLDDLHSRSAIFQQWKGLGFQGLVAVPLRSADRSVGAMVYLTNSPCRYDAADLEAIQTIGDILGTGLENAWLHTGLAASEEKYRSIFEAALDAILVVDETGRCVDANPQATALTGYSHEELLGKTIPDLTPPEQRAPSLALFEEVKRKGRLAGEFGLLRKDGSLVDVEYSATRAGPRMYRAVVRDLTGRKTADAERQRLMKEVECRAAELVATIEAIPEGVVVYAPTGKLVGMNSKAEQMFGYSPSERTLPIAERIRALRVETPEGDPYPLEEVPLFRALKGETVRGVVARIHPPGGKTLWTSNSAAPILSASGELLGVVGTITDITATRELQEQQEEYIHMISHDLRNPLTPAMGHASRLVRLLTRRGLEKEAASARAILESTRRLNSMISDLVESARLESGATDLRREPTDMCELIEGVSRTVGTLEEQARISVECASGVHPVLVDRPRMERVLMNLVVNALKYSPPESPVRISTERKNGEVFVSVADRGIGIPPEELSLVFQRHYRGSTGKTSEGLGLGLYIGRKLVEAHGGRIWAESEPGRGSTFTFTLPVGQGD